MQSLPRPLVISARQQPDGSTDVRYASQLPVAHFDARIFRHLLSEWLACHRAGLFHAFVLLRPTVVTYLHNAGGMAGEW